MTQIAAIESRKAFDRLVEQSNDRPVWLFKHSLMCPISSEALREFRVFAEGRSAGVAMGLLEIQRHRDLSREIAERTGVTHESPQVLLLCGGEIQWHASHWSITVGSLADAEREHVAKSPAGAS